MKKWIILLFGTCLAGCGDSGTLLPGDYVRWIEDGTNGLMVRRQVEGYEFALQYKPIEYIVAKQERTDRLKAAIVKKERAEMEDMQYYTLSIQTTQEKKQFAESKESNPEAQATYFSGPMQEGLKLVDGTDTLPCLLFQYEPTFNLRPFSNFLLAFDLVREEDGTPSNEDKTLIFKDKFLGIGPIYITIKGRNLDHIPSIKLY